MTKPAITVICRLCSSPADSGTTPIHFCAIIIHMFTLTMLIPEISMVACTSYELDFWNVKINVGQWIYCSTFSSLCRSSDVFHWTPSKICVNCLGTWMRRASVLPTRRKPEKNYRPSMASWSISRCISCVRRTCSHHLKAKKEWFLWTCGHSREKHQIVWSVPVKMDFRVKISHIQEAISYCG